MQMNRRRFGTMALGALAAPGLARRAAAQSRRGVVMLTFPGGTSAAWKKFYCEPFSAASGIPAQIVEMTDPTSWYMGRGSEFNCSIANPVDYALYQQGKVEAMKIADYPILQKIPEAFWTRVDAEHVLGMPVYQQVYGIAINRNFVKPGEITSWFDLAKPQYKGKVGMGGFTDIYEVPWFSRITGGSETNQESGLELYRKIAANLLTIPGSMAQMVQLLQRGEVIAAPFYSARVWTLKKSGQTAIEMVIPREGVPLIPYHLQLSRSGPDMDAARRFATFSAGAEPAARVADAIGYFPVNREAAFPGDFQALMGVTPEEWAARVVPMDYVAIGKTRLQMRDRIDQINANIGKG